MIHCGHWKAALPPLRARNRLLSSTWEILKRNLTCIRFWFVQAATPPNLHCPTSMCFCRLSGRRVSE